MSKNAALPYNDAPYTQVLYVDPATGRRTRSRIDSDLSSVRFEHIRARSKPTITPA